MKGYLFLPVAALALLLSSCGQKKPSNATPHVARELTAVMPQRDTMAVENLREEVQETPQFPGGYDKMQAYIAKHLRYPEVAREHHVEGRVIVAVDVSSTGKVSNARVVQTDNALLNDEARRVVASFPRLEPTRVQGKGKASELHVAVLFSLP